MKLVFASNNKNKIREVAQMFPPTIEILSLEDIGCYDEIPETADTIEENAILKANYVTNHYGYDCFADDSGLEVDALDGAPGVISARYAGDQRSDSDNTQKLLSELDGKTNREAQFKTVIALNIRGLQLLFTGIVRGEITTAPSGNGGFGYDPVFKATGYDQTFAEIAAEEKNRIGHRGSAVRQLIHYLEQQAEL